MGITDPTEVYFKDGVWGHDGSQWQKLALLWGFTDTYAEQEDETNAAAGANTLTFSIVPAGEVWVITNFMAWNNTTAAGQVQLRAVISGAGYYLAFSGFSAVTRYLDWQGMLVLAAGDYLTAILSNCVAGDDIFARAVGYKMAVS